MIKVEILGRWWGDAGGQSRRNRSTARSSRGLGLEEVVGPVPGAGVRALLGWVGSVGNCVLKNGDRGCHTGDSMPDRAAVGQKWLPSRCVVSRSESLGLLHCPLEWTDTSAAASLAVCSLRALCVNW